MGPPSWGLLMPPMRDDTLLRMRATDEGLDRALPPEGAWLVFTAAGNLATVWMAGDGATHLVAAAPAAVAAEVGDVGGVAPWSEAHQPLRRLELAVEAALVADGGERTTERVAEVRQRVGQDLFRDALMRYWGGRCAISGVGEPALLRASHAKPWKAAGHRSSAIELAGSSVLKSPS